MKASLCRLGVAQRGSIATLLRQHSANASASSSALVEIQGWVRTIRRQKKVSFISLHDGSDWKGLQAVVPSALLEQLEKEEAVASDESAQGGLGSGASVQLVGRLVEKQGGTAKGKGKERQNDEQDLEMQVESVRVLGGSDGQTYPIQPKDHSFPFLRKNAHLRGRTSAVSTMLRVRDTLSRSASAYFHSQECLNVAMPVITSSDCEGAGEVFSVTTPPIPTQTAGESSSTSAHLGKARPGTERHRRFWERPAYLSVSGQLHQEAVVVGGAMSRVWHLGPAFRAERSDTNRHLNEFWMCEAEICTTPNVDSTAQLGEVMDLVEGLVKTCVRDVARDRGDELLAHLPQGWKVVSALLQDIEHPFHRLNYSDAIADLATAFDADQTVFAHPPGYEAGLKSEHERYLASKYGPTFIMNYPASQKPFYMRANSLGSSTSSLPTVACFDLLIPRIGELAGGSLREERLGPLVNSMEGKGMNATEYEWYLDLRRYGTVPHGGFGLGWERLVSYLTGLENVRDCIPFPRGSEGTRF